MINHNSPILSTQPHSLAIFRRKFWKNRTHDWWKSKDWCTLIPATNLPDFWIMRFFFCFLSTVTTALFSWLSSSLELPFRFRTFPLAFDFFLINVHTLLCKGFSSGDDILLHSSSFRFSFVEFCSTDYLNHWLNSVVKQIKKLFICYLVCATKEIKGCNQHFSNVYHHFRHAYMK